MIDIILFVYRYFGTIDGLSHLHLYLSLSYLTVIQLILNLEFTNSSFDLDPFLYVVNEFLLDKDHLCIIDLTLFLATFANVFFLEFFLGG